MPGPPGPVPGLWWSLVATIPLLTTSSDGRRVASMLESGTCGTCGLGEPEGLELLKLARLKAGTRG